MRKSHLFNRTLSVIVLVSFLLSPAGLFAEAVDDKNTQIVPTHSPGGGEFIHGQGYGKILMRVLMFGSIPQQGVHYFPEGTDLLFAILYSGGYGESTKLNGINIRRRSQKELIYVNLEDLIEDGDKIPKIADGDIINVPYNWRRDMATIGLLTGFLTAMTGFSISLIALSR